MAQLVGCGGGEGRDVDVARIEGLDQSLDRAPLPGGVPSLEDDADGRSQFAAGELAAVDEAEVQYPELRIVQPFCLFVLRHASGEIGVLQPCVVVVGGCHDAY